MSVDAIDPLEELAEDVSRRLRNGEMPTSEDYLSKYPEYAEAIPEYIQSIIYLENLGSHRLGLSYPKNGVDSFVAPNENRLGDFLLIREIGRGGMGVVFEAEQTSLKRRVALKLLPQGPLTTERSLVRFQREAQAAGGLHHSNIVPVFGAGQHEGQHYYVMQLIHGEGLDKILQQLRSEQNSPSQPNAASQENVNHSSSAESCESHFDPQTAGEMLVSGDLSGELWFSISATRRLECEASRGRSRGDLSLRLQNWNYWCNVAIVGLRLARALVYAHGQGVLHRDMKPGNVLLDNEGRVWVADFGLAKFIEQENLTAPDDMVGTVRYAAPEQLEGHPEARSDIYGLGLILYELLAQQPAFPETNRRKLIHQVLNEKPTPLRKLVPKIPRELETIVLNCIAASPSERYRTAAHVAADLQKFLEDRPILARRALPWERVWRWARRNKKDALLLGLSGLMFLAMLLVSAGGYWRESVLRAEADMKSETAMRAIDRVFNAYAPDWSNPTTGTDASQLTVSPAGARLLDDLVGYFNDLANRNDPRDRRTVILARATALRKVGQIHLRLGQFEKAKTGYSSALARLQLIRAEFPDDWIVVTEIARIRNEIGVVYWTDRQMREAHHFHTLALKELTSFVQQMPEPPSQMQFEIAKTNYYLGRRGRGQYIGVPLRPVISYGQERFDQFVWTPIKPAAIRESIAGLQQLLEKSPNDVEYSHLLALCYCEQSTGEVTWDGKPKDEAAILAIELLEKLVANSPHRDDLRYSLAIAYKIVYLSNAQTATGIAEVTKRLEKSMYYSNELYLKNPQEWKYEALLADTGMLLAKAYQRGGHSQKCTDLWNVIIRQCRRLGEQYPAITAFRYWEGVAESGCGMGLNAISGYSQLSNRKHHIKAINILLECIQTNPEWAKVAGHDLLDCYKDLSNLYLALGMVEEADETECEREYFRAIIAQKVMKLN